MPWVYGSILHVARACPHYHFPATTTLEVLVYFSESDSTVNIMRRFCRIEPLQMHHSHRSAIASAVNTITPSPSADACYTGLTTGGFRRDARRAMKQTLFAVFPWSSCVHFSVFSIELLV